EDPLAGDMGEGLSSGFATGLLAGSNLGSWRVRYRAARFAPSAPASNTSAPNKPASTTFADLLPATEVFIAAVFASAEPPWHCIAITVRLSWCECPFDSVMACRLSQAGAGESRANAETISCSVRAR